MTFLPPAHAAEARPALFGRKIARPRGRMAISGEDSARRALGDGYALPSAVSAGASIEHLARIALG